MNSYTPDFTLEVEAERNAVARQVADAIIGILKQDSPKGVHPSSVSQWSAEKGSTQ